MLKFDQDCDYLPPTVVAFLGKTSRASIYLLYGVFALFVFFLIWAAFSKVDEITIGLGKIIPSQSIQVVDNLEGGILKDVLIQEGEVVQKGQILMKIENVLAQEKLQESNINFNRYLAIKDRLNAQVEEKPYFPSQSLRMHYPNIAEEEKRYYQAQQAKFHSDLSVAREDVAQKKYELLSQQSQLKKLQVQYGLVAEQIAIEEPLAKKKLVSQIDFLNLKRELEELKGNMNSLKANVTKAQVALSQAEKRISQIKYIFREEHLAELKEVEDKIQEFNFNIQAYKDRVVRTDLRSPVHGIVKLIRQRTIGSTINPGEDLVEIVPLDDHLLIEAKVSPADVAFLRPGLKALIKVTAYDFSVYGGMDATLEQISADSIQDEAGHTFFKVTLRTDKNYLGKNDKKMPIIPGMQVSVHIFTGKKTILSYLLKPFIKAKYQALTER